MCYILQVIQKPRVNGKVSLKPLEQISLKSLRRNANYHKSSLKLTSLYTLSMYNKGYTSLIYMKMFYVTKAVQYKCSYMPTNC